MLLIFIKHDWNFFEVTFSQSENTWIDFWGAFSTDFSPPKVLCYWCPFLNGDRGTEKDLWGHISALASLSVFPADTSHRNWNTEQVIFRRRCHKELGQKKWLWLRSPDSHDLAIRASETNAAPICRTVWWILPLRTGSCPWHTVGY